jgi:hypothetical protein
MTAIQPPTILNSFREHPVDKTGLQTNVDRPRTNQKLQDQVQATLAKPQAKAADRVELSKQVTQVAAKPTVAKAEAKPAEPPPPAVAPSATESAKGKSVNLLA